MRPLAASAVALAAGAAGFALGRTTTDAPAGATSPSAPRGPEQVLLPEPAPRAEMPRAAAPRTRDAPRAPAEPAPAAADGAATERRPPAESAPAGDFDEFLRLHRAGRPLPPELNARLASAAVRLLPRIEALVAAADTPWQLRAEALALLGDPRHAGNRDVEAALLRALCLPGANGTARAALAALAAVGDAQSAFALVQAAPSVEREAFRRQAIELAADLAKERRNELVAGVLDRAPDDAARVAAVALFATDRAAAALTALSRMRTQSSAVRRAAAAKLAEFSGREADELRAAWVREETDAAVVDLLAPRAAR